MPEARSNYIPYLDGFRAISIVLVFLSHTGFDYIIPGGFGVSIFFFISGLLITKLLVQEYNQTHTINFRKFYFRRVLRLYPALVFAICLAIIVLVILKIAIYPLSIISALFYFTNYYVIYFRTEKITEYILDTTWSLSVEEHFYLFFPFLFYWLFNKKKTLLWVLFILCIAALVIRFYFLYASVDAEWTTEAIYVSTQTRIDSIVWGCIAALLLYQVNSQQYLRIIKSRWSIVAGVALILLSLLVRNTIFRDSVRYSMQAVAFLLIIPSVEFYRPTSFIRKVLENKALVFIGKLSYSIYLFHWMTIMMADAWFKGNRFVWFAFVVLLTVILSLTSFFLVEKRFLELRKRYGSNVRE